MPDKSDPRFSEIPIGINASGERFESDGMGEIAVPADKYYGAQTARSLVHFSIGNELLPKPVYHAYGVIKKAAASVNRHFGRLDPELADAIAFAAQEAADGKLDAHFPLYVWQTGSGTQTNMNVNEVISNRANQLLGGEIGSKSPVHPNDHVNLSQSSNDSFPTAMHVAAISAIDEKLQPALSALADAIGDKADLWSDVVKIGRTHLQDAVPLTLGQEWSGYEVQLRACIAGIEASRDGLLELAAGGTAVGTGLNAPKGFSVAIAKEISKLTGRAFFTAPNKFEAQSSITAMVAAMSALRNSAATLLQIANNIRFLASGPRCGIGELTLPENEPGSSIMPGKVNPTQCEAMIQLCTQILGLDNAVGFAGAQGNFQLNTMRPMVIANFLNAADMLADGSINFRKYAVEGAEADQNRIDDLLNRTLMLVTALAPVIGYDKATEIAHKAAHEGSTLKQAALALGYVDEETFEKATDPSKMSGNGLSGA